MAGSIVEAMLAARNVDQQAVQGNTNAIRKVSLQANQSDEALRDLPAYNAYRVQCQQTGVPPVSMKQWQMMYRHDR